jgi:succinylarginine dihydrolase
VLREEELRAVSPGVIFNESLFRNLKSWIEKHYRDRLHTADLCDPHFNVEVETALDELSQILKLGSIYSFQI